MFDVDRFVSRSEMEVYQNFGRYYVRRRVGNRFKVAQNWRELEREAYDGIWSMLMPGDFHAYPCLRTVAARAVFAQESS